MISASQLGKILSVALPFGVIMGCIEPYPHSHDLEAMVAGSILFALVAIMLRNPEAKSGWLIFGLITVVCYIVPFLWYWHGAMNRGWWYPPQPKIIEQFFYVDGEAGYDAEVSNLFLVLWMLASTAFAIRHLTHRSKGRAANGAPLS